MFELLEILEISLSDLTLNLIFKDHLKLILLVSDSSNMTIFIFSLIKNDKKI